MSDALVSYQFNENAVRVVMFAGDPWFVAGDVAAVLGYRNAPDMVRNLDDDEKGTHIMRTLGGSQDMNIISESGLYAAILKSRREEAKKFRRWVTGEVLPTLRRTGAYALAGHERYEALPNDYDATRLTAAVGVVREARRLFGPAGARRVWAELGLPEAIAETKPNEDEPLAAPLKAFLNERDACTIEEAAAGIGVARSDLDDAVRRKLGQLLRLLGWAPRKERYGGAVVNMFRPMQGEA